MIQRPLGLEPGNDGNAVGRDPRGMTVHELRQLGHLPMTAQEALRSRCLDCCAGLGSRGSGLRRGDMPGLAFPAWQIAVGARRSASLKRTAGGIC